MLSRKTLMERLRAREIEATWPMLSAIVFVGGYVVMSIAGQILAVNLVGDNVLNIQPGTLALGGVIGALVIIAVTVLWARRRFGAEQWRTTLHDSGMPKSLITYLLLGLGMAWAIDLIGRLFQINNGLPVPSILVALGGNLGVNWIIAAILALVVQPLADTLVFQGILYPVLARDLRRNLWAILATAVIYAIVNLALSSGVNVTVWYILIQPFLMALVVTAVRAYTQSLRPAFATRAMFGLFFLFSALILKV